MALVTLTALAGTLLVVGSPVAASSDVAGAAVVGPDVKVTAAAPSALRVAGQAANALVDSARPALSWSLNDSARGAQQTAYQVRVLDVPSDVSTGRHLDWDSSRVASAVSTAVTYRGPALAPGSTYEWTVRTWNGQGQVSLWSAPQQFDVGLLSVSDWTASWLGAADGSLVRKSFTLTKPVARARLFLGAQGLVEPHLNGALAAPQEVLDSSVTDYAQRVVYRDLDVTAELHQGLNALSVMVGQGQFAGTPAFIAQLQVTYTDGGSATFGTDSSWRSAVGPVIRDDFYYGESYDARRQLTGWDTAGFNDTSWATVPVYAAVSQPTSLALGRPVTALDETACCGWSRAALVDGIDRSTDSSEGYHSAIAADTHATKWVQTDLGQNQDVAKVTLFPAFPTNDTAPTSPGVGFPVRYKIEVSDDPTFASATVFADRTRSDQINPGITAVGLVPDPTVGGSVNGRYVRVTATALQCVGASCTFRLAELGVYGAHPAPMYGLTRLEADTTPPARMVASIAPKKTTASLDGSRLYDFGQNYAGQITLTSSAPAGTTVTVVKGEILDANGNVSTSNISFSPLDPVRQKDQYTFAGDGRETWRPHFNYAGFRYAQVTGLPASATVTVTANVIHNDVAVTGSFSTSDAVLNSIQTAVTQTQLNGLQSMPLDTPTREKHGWLGDAGDSDVEAMSNFDMQSEYGKWLGDIRTSLSINSNGALPSVAPNQGNRAWFTDPAWGSAYPQIVWDSYTQYGDPAVLSANYLPVKNWVDYLGTISDGNHIVTMSPGSWGDDWQATVSTPHVFFQTLFYLSDARRLAAMAGVLGKTADVKTYSQLAIAIAAGFNKVYFNTATGVYGTGTQLSYAMPLALGIAPTGQEAGVLGKLVADIDAHGDHLTTGFVGTAFVYQALAEYHRNDVAVAISQRTDYPSFGYMVTNGPGTIWEKWIDSSAADGTSSKDHIGLAGSIGQWSYQQLAGIQPGTAGYTSFTLAPSVVGNLTHVSATQQTVRGTITSAWQVRGSTLTYQAQVPVGSTASIRLPLPGGASSTVTEGGRAVWTAGRGGTDPGLKVGTVSGGVLALSAGSGHYSFTVLAPPAPVTHLALTPAESMVNTEPGRTVEVPVTLDASSTTSRTVAIGAAAGAGWTVSADPTSIPLTAAATHSLATVRLTPPASASGVFTVGVTARASDGTVTSTPVTVTVLRSTVLFDFESGVQGWQAGTNVSGVAAVTSIANQPGTPHGGAQSLEATANGSDASQWRTISVTPAQPLDLSASGKLTLWLDAYGGAPGATGYQARVRLVAGASDRTVTVGVTADSWNQITLDVSDWAPRADVTSMEVDFSALGTTVDSTGRFQIDDVRAVGAS